ncbi:DUF590-domain-containing protein [Ramicandelaber brevisporus]|nr:DUF590-domain-containing protein [Ramicandelaber brevisporus]
MSSFQQQQQLFNRRRGSAQVPIHTASTTATTAKQSSATAAVAAEPRSKPSLTRLFAHLLDENGMDDLNEVLNPQDDDNNAQPPASDNIADNFLLFSTAGFNAASASAKGKPVSQQQRGYRHKSRIAAIDPPEYADYVISLRLPSTATSSTSKQQQQQQQQQSTAAAAAGETSEEKVDIRSTIQSQVASTLHSLVRAGLGFTVANDPADPSRAFVFVVCPRSRLIQEARFCREADWVKGTRSMLGPDASSLNSLSGSSNGIGNGNDAGSAGSSIMGSPPPSPPAVFAGASNSGGISGGPGASRVLRLHGTSREMVAETSDAERLRLVHRILTGPPSEECAGITPWSPFDIPAAAPSNNGESNTAVNASVSASAVDPAHAVRIESIFPLHDKRFNRQWLKRWSTKWSISYLDIEAVRDHFGEHIAMYFAFLQFYFVALAFPTLLGLVGYFFLGGAEYTMWFAMLLVIWSVVFTEGWARRQTQLAVLWGSTTAEAHSRDGNSNNGASGSGVDIVGLAERNPRFVADQMIADPITGEVVPYFSPIRRWLRRAVTLPILGGLALIVSGIVTVLFLFATFFEEYYSGPFALALNILPIIAYSAVMGKVGAVFRGIARRLNEYENHETRSDYAANLTVKIFVFSFINDIFYMYLTSWLFIPFRDNLEWILRWMNGTAGKVGTIEEGIIKAASTPARDKLRALQIYFILTGQAINFAFEVVVPYVNRYLAERAKAKARAARAEKRAKRASEKDAATGGITDTSGVSDFEDASNSQSEVAFLKRVAHEASLATYDIYDDYVEMVSQFGYVSLFSIVYAFTPVAAFINNFIELRADAAKLCIHMQRPIPQRAAGIGGPWMSALRFLAWLSAITNAIMLYQFYTPSSSTGSIISALFGWMGGAPPETQQSLAEGNTTHKHVMLGLLVLFEHIYLGLRLVVPMLLHSVPSAAEIEVRKEDYLMRLGWLNLLTSRLTRSASDESFEAYARTIPDRFQSDDPDEAAEAIASGSHLD